jgi:hypothetical protein
MIGGSFEEMLKEADVAEARSPGAGGSNEHALRRVTKTSDVVLTQGPKVFNLAIGWESAQVPPPPVPPPISPPSSHAQACRSAFHYVVVLSVQ